MALAESAPILAIAEEPRRRPSRRVWKVRGMMAIVVLAALALGLGIPAARIADEPDYHVHTSLIVSPDGREWFLTPNFEPSPFWPRYSRYLRGLPWRGQSVCRPDGHAVLEACVRAHPEVVDEVPFGSTVQFRLSPEQRAAFERTKARVPGAMAYGLDRKPIR